MMSQQQKSIILLELNQTHITSGFCCIWQYYIKIQKFCLIELVESNKNEGLNHINPHF